MWIVLTVIYFCIFSSITAVTWLLCHMIFRNHNNMLLKKHFWLLSMLKTVVLHNICVKNKKS